MLCNLVGFEGSQLICSVVDVRDVREVVRSVIYDTRSATIIWEVTGVS